MALGLEGKSVLVTGAGPGLGQELVRAFLAEGANVTTCCRREAYLAELTTQLQMGPDRFQTRVCDVTDVEQCRAVVDAAVERFGRLDVVVNSAYDPGPTSPFESVDLSLWMNPIAVNVMGAMNVIQAAIPALKAAGMSFVVNVNSMVVRKPLQMQSAYVASKGALAAATKSLALELGGHGIRVNSVAMGWMWGDSVERTLDRIAASRGVSASSIRKQIEAGIPIGQIPEDADCARAVVFLGSEYAKSITGAMLDVNGGEFMP